MGAGECGTVNAYSIPTHAACQWVPCAPFAEQRWYRHGRTRRTLLETQDPRADDARGMGIAVRRLRAVLPAEARGRVHAADLLHARGLQAARPRQLPLQR